ncbi:MAG: PKD domain-containing protein [bacterium]
MKTFVRILAIVLPLVGCAASGFGQPIARFTANPLQGDAPLTVQFNNRSQGEITSNAWVFGDGQTSNARNPEHTYTVPGVYTVKLTVTGPGGSDTKERADYITVTGQALNRPRDLTAQVADNAVALQWMKPATGDGGAPCDTALVAYDDGSSEVALTTTTDNIELCVRFTPDSYPATVLGMLFLGGISTPDEYGLWVYLDPDGQDNGPAGDPVFAGAVNITQVGANGGVFPDPIVVESGDFYISLVNLPTTNGYAVGLDNNSADAGRSWLKLNQQVQRLTGTQFEGNLVIDAVVEQCNAGSTIITTLTPGRKREPLTASPAFADVATQASLSAPVYAHNTNGFARVGENLLGARFTLSTTFAAAALQGFHVYRSTTPPVQIDPANRIRQNQSADDTTFTDPNLQPGTYYYAVTAQYDQGESGPSNEIVAQIVATTLNPPRDLQATVAGNTVALDWLAPENGGGGGMVPETEPNDSPEQSDPFAFGETAQGAIDPEGDGDFWQFQGTSGQRAVIDVDAQVNGSALDAVIGLFVDQDDDGDGLPDIVDANDDSGGSLDSRLDLTLPRTDRYFILIVDFSALRDNLPDEGGPDYFYEMSLSSSSTTTSAANPAQTSHNKRFRLDVATLKAKLRAVAQTRFEARGERNSHLTHATAELQSYNVYRATSTPVPLTPSNRIATVDAGVTTFDDTGLSAGTYHYAVAAVYDDGESGPSNEASATVSTSGGTIEVRVEDTQTIGSEFWVDIAVAGVANFFGVSFDLGFTNSSFVDVVTPTSSNVVPGDFLGNDVVFATNVDEAAGTVSIGISRKSGQGGVDGGGVVARVKFVSRPSTPPGTQSEFSLRSVTANDPDGQPISLSASGATVTFTPGLIVWPGDTDNNGVVNQADVLPLGLHWGRTGPARDNASTAWVGQPAEPWTPETATYADANGNGVVNQTDVLPIGLNWGQTHSAPAALAKAHNPTLAKLAAGGTAILRLEIVGKANPGEAFQVKVIVENVSDLFGISFEIAYSPTTFMQAQKSNAGDFLGSDIVFVDNITEGLISIGLSRKAGQGGVDNSGVVAIIDAVMSNEANIEDHTSLTLQNVAANDPNGVAIEFEVQSGAVITDVHSGSGTLPDRFVLNPNFPNPFNPGTQISYALPRQASVRIDIYDLLGRQVRTLVDETMPAGRHAIVWDGRDQHGQAAASGVYIYRIRAGEFVESRRMLLVK